MTMITITGDKRLIADLNRLAGVLPGDVEEVLDDTADFVKDDLKAGAPVKTGDLSDSMAVTKRGAGYREIGAGGGSGSKGSPLPRDYAIFVEEGSGAHWPNVSNLRDRLGLSESEAYLMAKSISQRSRLGVKFFEDTFDKVSIFFQKAVESIFLRW